MNTLTVGLGDRSYPILIKKELFGDIGSHLSEAEIAKRYFLVADEHVAEIYSQQVLESLDKADCNAQLITFPRGEESKTIDTVAQLTSTLAANGCDRKDGLIALGGGVTGDITGFLAAVYMRGIPFVQIPTTLLAQVDSSVGGKTGVDIPEGKNLVGSFYQPKAVYIDSTVLLSLPKEELLNGLAEVIKYGVIYDEKFFNYLDENYRQILNLDLDVMEVVIRRCCEIKAAVVAADEKESDLRRILNFGHTIGHAVEGASDYTIAHGVAVGMGMVAAAKLAVLKGIFSQQHEDKLTHLIKLFGLTETIPTELNRDRIKQYLKTDKKTIGGRPFFVLPTTIGRVIITDEVESEWIDQVLV